MIDEVTRARFVVLRDEDTGEVRHTDYQLYTRINIIPPTKARRKGEREKMLLKSADRKHSQHTHLTLDLVDHIIEVLLRSLMVTFTRQTTVNEPVALLALLRRYRSQHVLSGKRDTLGLISGF